MAISYNDYLTRPYCTYGRGRDLFPSELSSSVTLESGCFNKISLKVKVAPKEECLEIPCVVLDTVIQCLEQIKQFSILHPEEVLYIPLFKNGSSYNYRTRNHTPKEVKSANPLLKELFIDTPGMDILNWCKCGSTTYYGGPGILFFEDMTPLLMFSLLLEKTNDNKYLPKRAIIRVSPKVYTNDDLMCKHIRTKMLCNMMDMTEGWINRIFIRNNSILSDTSFPANFKVVIENFDKEWFDRPTVPTVNTTSESINDFISAHLTENDF